MSEPTDGRAEPLDPLRPPSPIPKPPKKSSSKSKHKECADCKTALSASYQKSLCTACIDKLVAEQSKTLTRSMKSLIKASFKAFSKGRARSPDKATKYDSREMDSSDSEARESGQLDSSNLDSSDEEYSGKSFFSPDDTQPLLKAVRATMQLEDIKETRSVADQAFQALGPKRHRVFSVHESMQAIIKKEWKNPDKVLHTLLG
ncbi:uncharacterized protein LOC122928996 [Bufo gargarizans]|uniref:uncharacterized protein LOC122928996 n=1 Tax=Bufo gargarizans TaxID=30331 RepID=UPI001CF31445|nr:uncharacterized protein LOC122928996 [Bufo gargarizans]